MPSRRSTPDCHPLIDSQDEGLLTVPLVKAIDQRKPPQQGNGPGVGWLTRGKRGEALWPTTREHAVKGT